MARMKEIETVRTHDKLYLSEDRKHNPKEYFKFILKEMDLDFAKSGSILDVGCATGDFLWFLKENLPDSKLVGVDVDEELIQRAKVEVPNAEFICANIAKDKLKQKFDLIFMLGVHSIFDKIEEWLDPMVHLLRAHEKATIYVFGIFNPEDLDVLIRSRSSSSSGPWETGWNLISKKTVLDYCGKKNWKCSFKDFQIGIDIEKNESDPLRSYTLMMENDERMVVNGLQLVHKFSLMVLQPN
jgi:SAM-dependent methyltransferase